MQIAEQFRALGSRIGVRDCLVIGGVGASAQRSEASVHHTLGPRVRAGTHECTPCGPVALWLADMFKQAQALDQLPHVVVATPGRLLDHLSKQTNTLSFRKLKFLVRNVVCCVCQGARCMSRAARLHERWLLHAAYLSLNVACCTYAKCRLPVPPHG
jgi:superfamily II DNA/RNA helicase